MIQSVSFIGLGAMGWHMASHLTQVCPQVYVWNRTFAKVKQHERTCATQAVELTQALQADIKEQGLISKDRQYVHLTENKDTALSVGARYGKPHILVIHALEMHKNGFEFFQAENGVWLVKHVPIEFITFQ